MFEIHMIVADKHVHEVLRLVHRYALEPPVSTPKGAQDELHVNPPKGNSIKLLRDYLTNSHSKQVTVAAMKEFLMQNGYSKNGYTYALQSLLDEGVLKKTKTVGLYDVVSK